MNTELQPTPPDVTAVEIKKGLSGLQVLGVVLLTVVVTLGLGYWAMNHYLFAREFKPVQLRAGEEQVLNNKLRALGFDVPSQNQNQSQSQKKSLKNPLKPEPYSEVGASREVHFSERELNAMLAKNTDLAQKVAIDISDNLVSALLLIPLEQDFPVLGGKTLRVHAGIELAYKSGRPVVKFRGVSLMGVPIPNAWLGNLKNVDLVNEFGGGQGFWNAFAAGVDNIRVEDGQLLIDLKE